MAYNPYNAVNAIVNFKSDWDKYNKSGDTKARDQVAENAKVYYDQLKKNGYGATADELSALDANGAKYILDQYSAKDTGVDNNAYNTSMKSATNKNNTLAGYVDSDRNDVQGEYKNLLNYANQDITRTDEYKSTYNSIMGKYDMSALQGRDNAAASGGASNGGNIDSYAAANAMRQQAALTATGQQIAHQAGLEAANARVSNVSNILNNLGVYNSGTYDAMNQTVNNDLNIANSYFTNAETAKNNDVARKSEIASVTGYAPDEWIVSNNPYMNDDGTIKDEYKNIDFSKVMANAKATGNTNAYNAAATARYYKIMGDYGAYGQYDDGNYIVPGTQQTEAGRQFDKSMDYNYYATKTGSDDTRYTTDANLTAATLQNTKPTLTASQAATAIKNGEISQGVIDAYNYYYGTTYTVDNPPKIGDDVGVDIDVDGSNTGGGSDSGTEDFDIVKKWEDGGNSFQTITIKGFDDTMAKESKVDEYGEKAIKSVISAVANNKLGANGVVSNFDIADYLITHSNENDTDKKQLKKVFAYFGISTSLLDYVEDVGKGKNLTGSDYKYGVEYKK